MFLSLRQALQEVHIHAVENRVVRFALNGEVPRATQKLGYTPMAVKKLCNEINKMQSKISQRLELKVEKDQLFKLRSKDSYFQVDRGRPPISLQQLINQDSRPLTEKTKRILAVLLSYAILHLHGTPWLQSTWDSSRILFFQTSTSTIPLRPFIQADFIQEIASKDAHAGGLAGHSKSHESEVDVDPDDVDPDDLDQCDVDPDDFEHPFPTLVTFAIILMELYFATPFSELARNRGFELPQGTENRKRSLDVTTIFHKYKREIPQNSPFYSGIEKCLDPRTWENESGRPIDDDMLRVLLYQEVIRPLEDDLCDAFTFITIEELDKIAEQVDVGAWGRTIPNMPPNGPSSGASNPPVEPTLFQQFQQFPRAHAGAQQPVLVALSWYPNSPGLSASSTPSLEYEAPKFYDDETSSENHSSIEYVLGHQTFPSFPGQHKSLVVLSSLPLTQHLG